jgi:hypothetical protein
MYNAQLVITDYLSKMGETIDVEWAPLPVGLHSAGQPGMHSEQSIPKLSLSKGIRVSTVSINKE